MNVAFLVDGFPRASQPFVVNQITGLYEREVTVRVFATGRPEIDDRATVPRELTAHRTTYTPIPYDKTTRLLTGARLLLTHGPRAPGPAIRAMNVGRYGRDALSLRPLLHLAPMVGESFDIVHCHFGEKGRMGAILKEVGVGEKLVTSFHGHGVRRAEEEPGRYDRLFRVGDLFLANSQDTYDRLAALGVDETRLVHHPVGIDVDAFPFRWTEPLSAVPDPLRLLTVARLEPVKGVDHAIRAVAILTDRLDVDIEYHVVGDGSQRDRLEALVKQLGIQERVVFHGHEHRDTVRAHLSEAHLFLLPSVAEAFGLVLLEAQAVGLPIVASDVGGIAEAVDEGETARLVPPEDANAIAGAVEGLSARPERWADTGEVGRAFVRENYRAERHVDELLRLYGSR